MPKTSFGTHTTATIEALVSDLEKAVDSLKSVRDSMDKLGVETMVVPGQSELERGMEGIESFTSNASRTLTKKKRDLGHYGVDPGNQAPNEERPKRRGKRAG